MTPAPSLTISSIIVVVVDLSAGTAQSTAGSGKHIQQQERKKQMARQGHDRHATWGGGRYQSYEAMPLRATIRRNLLILYNFYKEFLLLRLFHRLDLERERYSDLLTAVAKPCERRWYRRPSAQAHWICVLLDCLPLLLI